MPRRRFIRDNRFPYHVSSRCLNREWFCLPIEDVWQIFSDQLFFIHHAFEIKIHSFVLMHNHFHLIVSAPQNNLSEAMRYFLLEVSREIARMTGRINQVFGGRYFRTLLSSYQYYMHAYKYVYLNPVKAKICQSPESYRYSSLNGLLGLNKMIIPLVEDTLLFPDCLDTLNWLNEMPSDENWVDVRNALRKKQFALKKVDRNDHFLEANML